MGQEGAGVRGHRCEGEGECLTLELKRPGRGVGSAMTGHYIFFFQKNLF